MAFGVAHHDGRAVLDAMREVRPPFSPEGGRRVRPPTQAVRRRHGPRRPLRGGVAAGAVPAARHRIRRGTAVEGGALCGGAATAQLRAGRAARRAAAFAESPRLSPAAGPPEVSGHRPSHGGGPARRPAWHRGEAHARRTSCLPNRVENVDILAVHVLLTCPRWRWPHVRDRHDRGEGHHPRDSRTPRSPDRVPDAPAASPASPGSRAARPLRRHPGLTMPGTRPRSRCARTLTLMPRTRLPAIPALRKFP